MHGSRSVSVHSPGGAFWSIALHAPSTDPRELAKAALAALKAEYQDSEAEPARDRFGEQSVAGYDFSFFCLDFVNTAMIRGFRTPTATCLLLCQAEDREFEEIGPVFRAITASLLAPQ